MSRHTYKFIKNEEELTMNIGWDRPLGEYYFNTTNSTGEVVYSSLTVGEEISLGGISSLEDIDYFLRVHLGQAIPKIVKCALEFDGQHNAGNSGAEFHFNPKTNEWSVSSIYSQGDDKYKTSLESNILFWIYPNSTSIYQKT